MRTISTIFAGILLAQMGTTNANAQQAQLLINENFTGYSSGNLNGKGGWSQLNSSGTTANVVVLSDNNGALTKSGYTSGTNYLSVNNTGRDYVKNFLGNLNVPLNNTVFYLSFVVRVPNSSGTTTTGNARGVIGFRTSSNSNTAMLAIADANSGSNLRFGITTDDDDYKWSSTNYSFNTTYLIVIRYDAKPGSTNDVMKLWVNPASLESEAAMGTPAATISNGAGYTGTNINRLVIVQDSDGADFHIDGIKASYGNGYPTLTQSALVAWADLSAAGATLPVKFGSFEARPASGRINLDWTVGSEENVANYVVERSLDGREYQNIGSVPAKGSDKYAFADLKPADGVSYYRIKAVDHDGKLTYSAILTVKGNRSAVSLKAYPSPAISELTLQHSVAAQGASISIHTTEGRTLRNLVPAKGTQQTSINLSFLQPGMYVIRFDDGKGGLENIKIVKQ